MTNEKIGMLSVIVAVSSAVVCMASMLFSYRVYVSSRKLVTEYRNDLSDRILNSEQAGARFPSYDTHGVYSFFIHRGKKTAALIDQFRPCGFKQVRSGCHHADIGADTMAVYALPEIPDRHEFGHVIETYANVIIISSSDPVHAE